MRLTEERTEEGREAVQGGAPQSWSRLPDEPRGDVAGPRGGLYGWTFAFVR